jgi:hypothetical protein
MLHEAMEQQTLHIAKVRAAGCRWGTGAVSTQQHFANNHGKLVRGMVAPQHACEALMRLPGPFSLPGGGRARLQP